MEITNVWNDQIPEKDGTKLSVNDLAFSPDGARIIAAVGNRVLLYRASDGDLIDSLRGHKDIVYSVSYSSDGSRFASGGADNVVVIWKNTGQGLLKYNHSAPIQRVKYNPATLLLASCSEVDFGLWTPDQKQVTKEKVPSRIVSVAWSSDGTLLALGMLSGLVSIRNQQAEELLKIERKFPIWCITFIPEPQGPQRGANANSATTTASSSTLLDHADNLAIASWDKDYVLFKLTAKQPLVLVEKQLSYYPLSMHCVSNAFNKTSYVVLAGSNRQIQILSREGVKLAIVTKPAESWLWSVDSHGEEETMVIGSHFGTVEFMTLNFNSVHSLYKDRYAYRENLTEVIVHHLITDKKVRIKCKDMIHNLSLYRNKLAVQLLDRICVYESSSDDSVDIHFRLRKERITVTALSQNSATKLVNNLMVATSGHILVAIDNVLELYSMDGQRQKLWKLEGNILAMRVDGGFDGREGVLLGLSTGAVFRFYVENPFLIELTRKSKGLVRLDVNIYKTLLLTIDVEHTLVITDLATQETLFTQQNVQSACFNNEVEDLICFTNTNNLISVVSGIVPLSQYKKDATAKSANKFLPEIQELHLQGSALGFRGQKIFCLVKTGLVGIDVPQGANMQKALENQDFESAYKVACLGATEVEWRLLAMKALRSNKLIIAKNSFARLKDTKYLSLIEAIEKGVLSTASSLSQAVSNISDAKGDGGRSGRNRGAAANPIANQNPTPNNSTTTSSSPLDSRWQAEIMAYEGHYHEAAKILTRSGKLEEAIRMFVILRKWEEAKTFARNSGTADIANLTAQQAKWLQEIKDWRGAAELYISMGQYNQAAKIIGDNDVATASTSSQSSGSGGNKGWQHVMIEIVRGCPVEDKETLLYCGEKLSTLEDVTYAKEAYIKTGDYAKLMSLYIQRKMWTEAAKLADEYHGKFDMSVFLSYAEWLVSQDRYDEAMEAFKKCGRLDLSRKVLTELTENAVSEKRFKDAGYYYWMLAKEIEVELTNVASLIANEKKFSDKKKEEKRNSIPQRQEDQLASLQSEYEHKADLYYAYSSIHSYVTDPFTSFQPEMLFQVARFIINSLGVADTIPLGISKTSTLYTLAKQSMQLSAYKLARNAFERLTKLQIPEKRLDEIELDMLLVQAKPVRDNPDYLPVCYRCGSTNPLLNPFTNRFAKGDVCTNCGHPFVRSFINFDILPLVEFVPEPRITDDEAIDLIRQPPAKMTRLIEGKGGRWKEEVVNDNVNMLSFQQNNSSLNHDADQSLLLTDQEGSDLFTQCLNITLEKQKNSYTPVQVDANSLLAMKRSEVFVCKPSSKNKRATFYKNMLPELPIAISQPCHRFFHLEDFEFAYLSEKRCPYSRLKSVGEYGSV